MLEYGKFDTFCRSEALLDSGVLVLDVLIDYTLDGLDLIQTMIKSHNLTDELSSLWNKTGVNLSVDLVKAVFESLVN